MAILALYNQRLAALLDARPVILQILRFAAIGTLNTALDFIILNYLTKTFDITAGIPLGMVNVIGFSAAMVQSYLWNRAWAFSTFHISPLANAFRLIMVGGLGLTAFLLVILGGLNSAAETYYLFLLLIFIVSEIVLWYGFRLKLASETDAGIGHQFTLFMTISLVGLLINSGIVALASLALAPSLSSLINTDTIKNVSKILATGVSLIWNFLGYKLIVFKK
ncbi:MAG TPA: GtrA family protein [Candidatus Doudnabacteria bacterium]|nr:GtrA family protein [Candidatus Doudnabacteria bacterium]